ncbi:MAG: hypothetical protein R2710_08760 [Acidimicrobiales bacterium]
MANREESGGREDQLSGAESGFEDAEGHATLGHEPTGDEHGRRDAGGHAEAHGGDQPEADEEQRRVGDLAREEQAERNDGQPAGEQPWDVEAFDVTPDDRLRRAVDEVADERDGAHRAAADAEALLPRFDERTERKAHAL